VPAADASPEPSAGTSVLSAEELRLPTEQRLLLAAERLFAAHGIGAVSLRAVMAAAGANTAAVHYHFGSKDGLVAALLRDRTEQMHRRRLDLIHQVRAQGGDGVREVAEVLVRPILDTVAEGGADYVRVLGELMTRPDAVPGLRAAFEVQEADWDRLYAEVRPDLDPGVRAFRIGQGIALAVRVLGEADGYTAWLGERGADVNRHGLYAVVLAAVVGLLDAPQSLD
jgi:AcrR family transcriptional regulator